MEAFIVHDETREIIRIGKELQKSGFVVKSCKDQDRAARHVRENQIDLLVLKQEIRGRHTTGVALAAEFHNPSVSTILLSVRSRADVVEQFDLVPSIGAILPAKPDATFLGRIAQQVKQDQAHETLVLSPLNRAFPILNRRVA